MSDKIYEMIFDRISELVEENGTLPWQKPWSGVEPSNYVSKKPYRGINPFMLSLSGFGCPYWVSYKQAKKLGGQVKKGSRSMPVIFWKWIDKKYKNKKTGETETDRFPMLRYYNVFNLEQCDGIDWEAPGGSDIPAIDACENVVAGMPHKPEIVYGQTGAFYRPSTDSIGMPDRKHFIGPEEFYSTLFHEMTHSTGHDSRLGRHKSEKCNHRFGSKDYSKEELVAEFGAAFLSGHTGIYQETVKNSAAYVQGWLKKLKDNKKWLVQCSGQAQKATDYILNRKFEN